MAKVKYEGSEQFKPISSWGYIGYTILFVIPVIGWICLIVFALSNKNVNRRNLARSYWCALLVAVILTAAVGLLSYFNYGSVREELIRTFPQLETLLREIGTATERMALTSESNEKTTGITWTSQTRSPNRMSKPKVTAAPSSAGSSSSAGVRKSVKDAIDSYEAFFNEYAAFMKKYTSSSDALSMLGDYTKMMTRYAASMEKWEKFSKENQLNDAELKYYTEATIRIEKTLLSVN